VRGLRSVAWSRIDRIVMLSGVVLGSGSRIARCRVVVRGFRGVAWGRIVMLSRVVLGSRSRVAWSVIVSAQIMEILKLVKIQLKLREMLRISGLLGCLSRVVAGLGIRGRVHWGLGGIIAWLGVVSRDRIVPERQLVTLISIPSK